MQNQLIAPPKAPLASVKPTAVKGFKPLVTGSTPVDTMLVRHHVPKGSLLHFDFIGAPNQYLFAMCREAIERGESVAFIYVPSPSHIAHTDRWKGLRHPDPGSGPLNMEISDRGLDPFIDANDPTDPAARFRYIVSQTPDELEEDLDHLLAVKRDGWDFRPSPVLPDLVVVYGVEQVFAVEGLSEEGVSSRLERLRGWISTYSARCAQTGSTVLFGRSLDFHQEDAPPIVGAINDLLYERCHFGLAVGYQFPGEDTRPCAAHRQGRSATVQTEGEVVNTPNNPTAWQISLYKGNALLESLPLTDGDFLLESESDVEDVEVSNSQTVQSLTKAAHSLAIAARDLTTAIESLKTV